MMVKLVQNLSLYAKSLDPEIVIAVNIGSGLDLLEDPSFLSSVDIVVREEVWYANDSPTNLEERGYVLKILDRARALGKKIIVLDYAKDPRHVEKILNKAREHGFEAYVAPSYDLDTLALYVPTYHGIDATKFGNNIYVVWSFRGSADGGDSKSFDVYVAKVKGLEFKKVIRLGTEERNDVDPIVVAGSDGIYVLWSVGNGIDVAKLDEDLNIVDLREIGDEGRYKHLNAIYIDGELYVAATVVRSDVDIVEMLIVDTVSGKVSKIVLGNGCCPRIYSADSDGRKLLVLLTRNGKLVATIIDRLRKEVLRTIDLGVDTYPCRYGAVNIGRKLVVIAYDSQNRSSVAIILDAQTARSTLIAVGLPPIDWSSTIVSYGSIIAYSGTTAIHYLLVNNEYVRYVASTPTRVPTSTCRVLIRMNRTIIVVEPVPHEYNKLSMYEIELHCITTTRTKTVVTTVTMRNVLTITTTKTTTKTLINTIIKPSTFVSMETIIVTTKISTTITTTIVKREVGYELTWIAIPIIVALLIVFTYERRSS